MVIDSCITYLRYRAVNINGKLCMFSKQSIKLIMDNQPVNLAKSMSRNSFTFTTINKFYFINVF